MFQKELEHLDEERFQGPGKAKYYYEGKGAKRKRCFFCLEIFYPLFISVVLVMFLFLFMNNLKKDSLIYEKVAHDWTGRAGSLIDIMNGDRTLDVLPINDILVLSQEDNLPGSNETIAEAIGKPGKEAAVCPEGYQNLLEMVWQGTFEACDCAHIKDETTKKISGFKYRSCNITELQADCRRVLPTESIDIEIYNKKVICKKPVSPTTSVVSLKRKHFEEDCEEGYHECGVQQKGYFKSCLPIGTKCPINDLAIVPMTKDIEDRIAKSNNSLEVNATDSYWQYLRLSDTEAIAVSTRSKMSPLVGIMLSEQQPCLNILYTSIQTSTHYALGTESARYVAKCDQESNGIIYDERYAEIDAPPITPAEVYDENKVF